MLKLTNRGGLNIAWARSRARATILLMKSSAPKAETHSVTKEFLLFLSIPIGVILILAVALQGPALFAKPKYDFLYSRCPNFLCYGNYVVGTNGRLAYEASDSSYGYSYKPTLYYYSETQHSARQIQQSEATGYAINSSNVSPDGYTLWQNDGSNDGLLFWGGSANGNWYLKDGAKKKQLNLGLDSTYAGDVQFLGWVR